MAIIPGAENINWMPIVGEVIYWLGIVLAAVLILALFVGIYYVFQFNIKMDYFELFGSGKDGVFSFGKKKKNRFKWIKNRTAWKPLFPLFNKQEIEPFDSEFIYQGRQTFGLKQNQNYCPIRVNIGVEENQIRGQMDPAPYYMKNWFIAKLKENEAEFAIHNFWEDNKYVFMVIISVLMCCIICGVTIYLTYQYAAGGRADMSALSSAINSLTNIPNAGGIIPK
jgi:hypothetical protein